MSNREHYIQLIVDKLFNAFKHNLQFLLDIGKAVTDRANNEIRFKTNKEK